MPSVSPKDSLKQRSATWGLHVTFWVMILSLALYFAALSINGMYLLQRSLVLITANILLFYPLYFWIIPEFWFKKKPVQAVFLLFALILVVVVARYAGDLYLMDKFDRTPQFVMLPRRRMILMFFGELVFAGFTLLVRLTVRMNENKKRMDEMERLQLNTELQFLKSQMSPHFLFNSINNIYSLVLMKSDKAPGALMKLSDLLRYALYDCHGKVLLSQEINAVRSYIELFRLKFEEDPDIVLTEELKQPELCTEPLLFIPLIENACKYSGVGMEAGAFIKVRFFEEGGTTVINILNSKGMYHKDESASGIGLTNIRKRLENTYSGKHELSVRETETTFELTLKLWLI